MRWKISIIVEFLFTRYHLRFLITIGLIPKRIHQHICIGRRECSHMCIRFRR
ncbi:hypothetical protein HanXRQr2_Chr03g0124291 [Helianthus annuus]|uniref:Uncharacterized protein n=1 Tax=Helianthus annuus TaxID=4232 RepID=A0A9K3JH63_HELAN|nr:hypothetical protein HanXRQr2_Chr03g0124291 [Helianthus annuus]